MDFGVATTAIQGSPGENLTLNCSIEYPSPDVLNVSVPMLEWSTTLSGVDIIDQSFHMIAEFAYLELHLSNLDSSNCGGYTCSAMDQFTGLPSIGETIVNITTGIL